MKKIFLSILFLISARFAISQNISSPYPLVFPRSPAIDYIVENGQTIQIKSAQSVTFLPGTHLHEGSNVSVEIGNVALYPVPPANPVSDSEMNWVFSRSYDEDGNVMQENKAFFDELGKLLQTQYKDISNSHVLASQPIYDAQGRAAAHTLYAPVNNSGFAYKGSFVANAGGVQYDYRNFDLTKTNNPDAVGNSIEGTLGWYYSNNNTTDLHIPATGFPYARSTFYKDGTLRGKGSAAIGDELRMGKGRETGGGSFSVINELNHYKSIRDKFFTATIIGDNQNFAGTVTQQYNIDENGTQGILLSDTKGKILVSALSNSTSWLSVTNEVNLENKNYKYVMEFPIGGSNEPTVHSFTIKSPYTVKGYIDNTLNTAISNNVSYTHPSSPNASTVKIISEYPFSIADDLYCDNCPSKLYQSNKAHHYFRLYKPSTVNFTGTGTKKIYNMSGDEQEVSGFSSGGTLPIGYYKAVVTGDSNATLTYSNSFSDITYNYYNQLGQLIASIAPNGVKAIIDNGLTNYATLNDVPFVTTYEYDLQGRLIASTGTDDGKSEYIYRKDGNIRFSQNALQKDTHRFSYSHYDRWGRPVESGEYVPASDIFVSLRTNDTVLESTEEGGGLTGGSKQYWTKTYYDQPDNSHGLTGYLQDEFNLRGAVSHTQNEHSHTWYNYDEQGRVTWMVKQQNGLSSPKTINYSYNAQGNVSKVDFQRDMPAERFIHEYEYDADGRLQVAYTGTSPAQRKEQARYYYYLHGPLKRIELAEHLQGIDYTYTPQGWLKAINHPDNSKDPGKDGDTGSSFAPDAFGMTLEYFPGDYSRSGTGISSLNTGTSKTYYNGNIGAQSWRSEKPASVTAVYGAGVNDPAMFTYEYDNRYRFSSNKYGMPDFGNNSFTEGVNKNREHGLTYDANGNIQALNRNDRNGNAMHNFSYHYQSGTNKLSSVANYASYEYDVLGQLSHQQKDNQHMYLSYDVSGKVTGIYSDENRTQLKLSYRYDEGGMRIYKKDHTSGVESHYVYDAGGNVLAVYDNNGTALQQKEILVYADGRIGMYNRVSSTYQYELTDHLGNVRVVLNQNKTSAGLADVVYYSDYYPYGMPIGLASNDYRYGYQGAYAEVDKETAWNAFTLRNYDAAIGRWLSVDPYGQYALELLPLSGDRFEK